MPALVLVMVLAYRLNRDTLGKFGGQNLKQSQHNEVRYYKRKEKTTRYYLALPVRIDAYTSAYSWPIIGICFPLDGGCFPSAKTHETDCT